MKNETKARVEQLRAENKHDEETIFRISEAAGSNELTGRQKTDFGEANLRIHERSAEIVRLLAEDERAAASDSEYDLSAGRFGPFKRNQELAPEQRMSDWVRAVEPHRDEYDKLDFGKFVRGMATGNWRDAEREQRAMAEGTQSTGGAMVPSPLSAEILDLARNQSRVFRAGARVVPMESATLDYARIVTDPTATWKSENAPITESTPSFDRVQLKAKTLPALVRASVEVIEDAPNAGDVLKRQFAEVLALELDRVALRGSGTDPEPRGVRNTSGVTVTAFGGANGASPNGNGSYDYLIDAFQALRSFNYEPNGVIYAPRSQTTLDKLKDTTGQTIEPPDAVKNIPRYTTNQIPTNLTVGTSNDTTEVYVADWTQLIVGIRTSFVVKVLNERYMDDLQYGFVAYLRADVVLARATAFNVVTGIRP